MRQTSRTGLQLNLWTLPMKRPHRRSRRILSFLCAALGVGAMPLAAQRSEPNVSVSLPDGQSVARREMVNVAYSGDPGTYVALLRIDTDGNVTVLAPSSPNSRSKLTGLDEVRTVRFAADPAAGVGTVVILGSRTPFDFRGYRSRNGGWMSIPAGRTVTPEDAVRQFAERTTKGRARPSMDYVEYSVERDPGQKATPPVRLVRPGSRFDPCAAGLYGSRYEQWRCHDGRTSRSKTPNRD
jgi:hypothetical protein